MPTISPSGTIAGSGAGSYSSASSIASGWPLTVDERWSGLLKNVLHHFGVRARTG